jgi:propanol-preferring alcohol dehydrogenase
MRAMVMAAPGKPLAARDVPAPIPAAGEIHIRVAACGVCRTDLHVFDGELANPKLPLILGHEIVGRVESVGAGVTNFRVADRVGVPWLARACGECPYCLAGKENLCDRALFTGYTRDGGYAEFTVADSRFCVPIPEGYSDAEAAPLLCAGLIGYRSLLKAGDAHRIGIYGFGAAGHILAQVALHQGREVYAFTRNGDSETQRFARELGATWAGASEDSPPAELDAAILFAPVGALVPVTLRAVRKGGIVVCGGIHMSDIPSFPYELLWGERTVCSVANLTRRDSTEFMQIAAQAHIHTTIQTHPLADANLVLHDLRAGRVHGAAVLFIGENPTGKSA